MTDRPLTDAQYRALARFRHALRVFQRFSEQAARAHGLTPAQHQLLLAVRGFDGDGAPSVSEVAELLQLNVNSAGELVDRACAKDLLEREQDPHDGRRALLVLTPAAEATLADLSLLHRAELQRFRQTMNDVLHWLD